MINEIEIKNYKSFLYERIDKISPKFNLIIGENGHGKSNFYSALKFVLKIEEKSKISENQKRGLLNVSLEGKTSR